MRFFQSEIDWKRLLRGQLLAIGVVGLATILRHALELAWPGVLVPFALHFPAVVAAGFFAGGAGCITAIVLSVVAGWYFFLPPTESFSLQGAPEAINLALFVVAAGAIGLLAVLLNARMRQARRAEMRLQRAQLAGGVADWEWDIENDRVVWSPPLYTLHGLDIGGRNPSPNLVFQAMHPDDRPTIRRELAQARETGEALTMEYRVVLPSGNTRWLLSRAEAVRGRDGRPRRIVGVNVDVTKSKEAEHQRELMFHELNHRVKNNFQVIASLLRMQAGRIGDSAAREHLNNAMRRIMTMADVHGSLYKAGHINTVDFADYMRDLCGKISNSVLLNSRVKCHVRAETAVLKVDRAIPLGLVVNELVMNSVKHAFPGAAEGEIHVTFAPSGERFVLSVTDNGIGMPEPGASAETAGGGAGFNGGSGLGMRLIEAFTQQAGGELAIVRGQPGARFEISLPREIFIVSDIDPASAVPPTKAARSS